MLSRSCPHCRNLIRLPDDIGPDSVLRCPICHNITLGSALALKADTTWVVVDPTAEQIDLESLKNPGPAQPIQTTTIASNADPDNQEPYEVSEQQDDTPSLGFHIPKADRTRKQPIKHEDWVNFKPISHEDYQRRKRKTSSPIWQLIQVVLGGALAIPISLLLIWHVLGKDVGNIGPKVAKVAPWIVPKKFHPYPSLETDLPNSSASSRPAKGNSGGLKRDFDAELAQSLERSNQPSSSSTNPPPSGKPPESESVPEPNSSPDGSKNKSAAEDAEAMKAPATTSENTQSDDKTGDNNRTTEKLKSSQDGSDDMPPTEAAIPELSNSEKLVSFIANTRSAMEQWPKVQSESVAKRREVANDFYNSLSQAAEYYSIVSESVPASVWKKEIRQLAQDVAEDPELMQLIRTGGFAKVTRQADKLIDGSGFTVVGTIEPKKDVAKQSEPQPEAEASEEKAETQASDAKEASETVAVDASTETLYVIRIRKSLIAGNPDGTASESVSEEVRERIVRLHPTTTIGENLEGDFLLLLTAGQATSDDTSPIDTVWFAIPIPQ
jgi:hypothetical protein